MKKLLLIICCCSISIITVAQQINEPFEFPVRPGTEVWSTLKTEKERFSAMQIPDEILKRMSSSALVVSCINFPAFGYIGAYGNYQTGFIILATKFNGLKELADRSDAEQYLINDYRIADLDGSTTKDLGIVESYWPIRLSWIELLLAQKKLIGSLDIEGRNKLIMIAQNKLIEKQGNKIYSTDGRITTVFLIGRLMHSLGYSEFESAYVQNDVLKKFIDTSELLDPLILDRIYELSNNYMKNLKK